MEIRNLRTFQVVAEELNLTKAAIRLNYSQPTVTKHIKILEEEIGAQLIIKENGKYTLTHAGELLYRHTNTILKEITMIKEISAEMGKKQTLELQSLDYYCYNFFVPAIKDIVKKYPATSFQIKASSIDDTFSKIIKNEIDLGIVVGKMIPPNIESAIIGYEKFVLAISTKTAHKFKNKDYYLENYPVIVHRNSKYMYYNFFNQGLTFPMIIDCDSDEVIKESVLAGDMIAIIGSSRLQKEVDNGEIMVLDVLAEKEAIHLVKNKKKQNSVLDYLFNCIANPAKEEPINFQWSLEKAK